MKSFLFRSGFMIICIFIIGCTTQSFAQAPLPETTEPIQICALPTVNAQIDYALPFSFDQLKYGFPDPVIRQYNPDMVRYVRLFSHRRL